MDERCMDILMTRILRRCCRSSLFFLFTLMRVIFLRIRFDRELFAKQTHTPETGRVFEASATTHPKTTPRLVPIILLLFAFYNTFV
ncbi:hypothetical protein BDN72DRAFT_236763 [Pluteus cervinus]|uniref:Uncharacterized protein n=1 Tax=Pluteus cervinus TaxID=181527 RepID=A0ACD3BEH8_9AGAR|nr:hypothetical protein BDN72DRAFT_236763 [Pluteus cervinus]